MTKPLLTKRRTQRFRSSMMPAKGPMTRAEFERIGREGLNRTIDRMVESESIKQAGKPLEQRLSGEKLREKIIKKYFPYYGKV